RILELGVAAPDRALSEMALVAPQERAASLEAASGDGRLHDGAAEAAALHPDAPAILHRSATLTYRELDERATRGARRLAALGVRPGDRVPVRAESAPALGTAALGILRAGAAYAPVDPALPAARVAHMLADLQPRVILAESPLMDLPRTGT